MTNTTTRTHKGHRTMVGSAAVLTVGAGLALASGLAAGAQAAGPTRTHIDTSGDPTVTTVTFFAAGRVNFLNHPPDQVFVAVPDSGSSRNLDELCRELAP